MREKTLKKKIRIKFKEKIMRILLKKKKDGKKK